MKGNKRWKNGAVYSARECAFIAVFVALVIAAQLGLSAIPGVEVVTLLFVAYAFTFGRARGMAAATAFTVLRQLVFGVYPTVFLLYVVYYNLLAFVFGSIGRRLRCTPKRLWIVVLVACVCTIAFTLLDDVITPWFYGYSAKSWRLYFYASLPFMAMQTACTAITVALLFLPLRRAFALVARVTRIPLPRKKTKAEERKTDFSAPNDGGEEIEEENGAE